MSSIAGERQREEEREKAARSVMKVDVTRRVSGWSQPS